MKPTRIIFFTWLAWALIVIAFQAWADARVDVKFPDDAVFWTARETGPGYQQGQKYLLEPFMNHQVAWDSEYYLAIAVGGYDDPATDLVGPAGNQVTKSYAFLPFFPLLIRLFMFPLSVFGLNPIATATLAGVIVSALGALGAMFALYDMTKDSLGEEGGLRGAFYLIIFPTAFFLVQVYTEGVFVGLVFGTVAMIRRKQWALAALLSVGAVLTRAVGVALIIPMLIGWLRSGDWADLDVEWKQIYLQGLPKGPLVRGLLALAPFITFLIWKFSYYGLAFDFIEQNFFGSTFMNIPGAIQAWTQAFQSLSFDNLQRSANYSLIVFLFALALVACFKCMRDYPEVAWLSLTIILISWGSGPPSGMHRYVLTTPAVFVALAHWGKNPVFDRAWTIASILWMGLNAAIFAMDMWVA
jgi:Gpi18-like mannosyltransferase